MLSRESGSVSESISKTSGILNGLRLVHSSKWSTFLGWCPFSLYALARFLFDSFKVLWFTINSLWFYTTSCFGLGSTSRLDPRTYEMHVELFLEKYSVANAWPWFVRIRDRDLEMSQHLSVDLVIAIAMSRFSTNLKNHFVELHHCHWHPQALGGTMSKNQFVRLKHGF